MEKHEEFTEWAIARGANIDGIVVHRFPGRGLGIMAERNHPAGSTILTVPLSALRAAATVPKSISRPVGPITVHGLLAADLVLDKTPNRAPWRAVMPSYEDFKESMPLMWPSPLQELLPPISKSLLENQKRKLSLDWESVHNAFPEILYDEYLYNWLIVNTRTFHYTSSSRKVKKPTNPDDCMALNPFADYFNHTDAPGCTVEFGPSGYTITSSEAIQKGDEIYISYGNHSNDFLLTEYGFILLENQWDEMSLDPFVLPLLSDEQKKLLKEAGFLGKYTLDKGTICYRTQVVLRLICLPVKNWQRFVNGLDSEERDQPAANQLLIAVLKSNLNHAQEMIEALDVLDCGLTSQRTTLCRRWKQICLLLKNTITRL